MKLYTKAMLVRIMNLSKSGVPIPRIAAIMSRSPGAITLILRECRRMEMMQSGSNDDTLIS